MPLLVGSTFSGAGGFELGFAQAGARTTFVSEIDKNANAVLAHRFPTVPNVGDIQEIDPHDLPPFNALVGGFPCQDLSVAGRRAGLAGERSGLFFAFHALLRARRPRWLVLENVPGLLSSNRGADFARVLHELDDLGYGLAWRVLDAQFLGVPQRRRRVFIVGCLGDPARAASVLLEREGGCWNPPARPAPRPEAAVPASCSTLQGGPGRGYRVDAEGAAGGHLVPVQTASRTGHGWWSETTDGPSGTVDAHESKEPGSLVAYRKSQRAHHADDPETWVPDDCAGTLSPWDAGDASRTPQAVVDGDLAVRRLTPRECERLQGFPDDWTDVPLRTLKNGKVKNVSDSGRYSLMGNAVAVPVVAWIARRLAEADGGRE